MDYDCEACGACCVEFFGADGYIPLDAREQVLLERLALRVGAWHGQTLLGTRPHGGPGGERCCVAFVGEVGGPCACAIYPERPGACRRFVAGSLGCQFARAEAGLPV